MAFRRDVASDQYQDVVALLSALSALSTKPRDTANAYGTVDGEAARRIDRYVNGSRYVPPDQR